LAYLRTTAIDRRRRVLDDWSAFVMGKDAEENVLPFGRRARDHGEAAS